MLLSGLPCHVGDSAFCSVSFFSPGLAHPKQAIRLCIELVKYPLLLSCFWKFISVWSLSKITECEQANLQTETALCWSGPIGMGQM